MGGVGIRRGSSIFAVACRFLNFFNNWRREVAKLGDLSCFYDYSVCVKSWEVGLWFRSSLLGSYCGGSHGRVIGVFAYGSFSARTLIILCQIKESY